jgi:NTE family protein
MLEEPELTLGAPAHHPRTVVVLGGGGMKGVAHVGVWKALEESGIRVDAIVGTSMGAAIGACLAGGMGWRELVEVTRTLKRDDIVSINRRSIWLGGVREAAVFDGAHYLHFLERIIPEHDFAKLKIPLRINAVSLVTGEEVWFGSGINEAVPLPQVVYASCALPIYFPPAKIGNDVLVDGGILDCLPIQEAGRWGAERVIAVDVGADLPPPEPGYFEKGMIAIHDRVLGLVLQNQRRRCLADWNGPSLTYIRPKIGHLGGWDFDRTQFLLEEGYRAGREALAQEVAA